MPTRLLIAADLHGDINHSQHLIARAKHHRCHVIYQLGDFGYWEHENDGIWYLDRLSYFLVRAGLTLDWICGNHENLPLLWERYSTAPKTPEGFWEIRPNIHYIPRATAWSVEGIRFLGLGGAYSVDKYQRLEDEHRKCLRNKAHYWCEPGSLWWPEEELTHSDVDRAISLGAVDIMLTHDKPRSSNPGIALKSNPDCWPNQDRISQVMQAVQPKLLLHGHLHYPYRDHIRIGNESWCEVIGLDANPVAGRHRPKGTPLPYNREDSWTVLELTDSKFSVVVTPPALR